MLLFLDAGAGADCCWGRGVVCGAADAGLGVGGAEGFLGYWRREAACAADFAGFDAADPMSDAGCGYIWWLTGTEDQMDEAEEVLCFCSSIRRTSPDWDGCG